jgi:nucleotide-binding universal stress UspA family protein
MSNYRIVVGVDGTEGADRALRWAAGQAEARGGTVQAVMAWSWDGPSVAGPPVATHPSEVHEFAERTLAEAVQAVSVAHPATIATEAIEGRPATVLVRAAADADLLVLGSHGHGRLHHAVLGSVTEECVRAATCPVVVVPVRIGVTIPPAPAEVAVN